MSRKQVIILIIFVFIIVLLNNFFVKFFDIPVNFRTKLAMRTNNSVVSSQQLFNLTWREIRDSYYDSSMNNQKWSRWKEHYRDKINTDEDAKVAIGTMLESLNDPYSNFMSKQEFAEQNLDIDSRVTGIGVNIASLDGKIVQVIPTQQDQVHRLRNNPFRGASDNRILRLDSDTNKIELISKYPIKEYIIRYLSRPLPIILEDLYDELVINNYNTKMECQLNPALHKTILDKAVRMALISKSININKQQ